MRHTFLGAFSRIFYKNYKFEPSLHSFELSLGILTFTKSYLAKHKMIEDTVFEVNFGEYLVVESILDPYNLVAKISDSFDG